MSSPPTTRTAATATPTTSRSIAWDCVPRRWPVRARVFMATMNRDYMLSLADRADELGLDMPDEQRSMLDTLGVHAERITTAVDVSAFLDRKRRAMEAHASQITDTSFFLTMPPEAFAAVWGTEWYIRVGRRRRRARRGLAARPCHDPARQSATDNAPGHRLGRERHACWPSSAICARASTRKLAGLSDEDARRRARGLGHHAPRARQAPGLRRGLLGATALRRLRRGRSTGDGFELDPADTVESVRQRYPEAGRRTDEIVAACRRPRPTRSPGGATASRCAGCSPICSRRRRATPGTPTSCASSSTAAPVADAGPAASARRAPGPSVADDGELLLAPVQGEVDARTRRRRLDVVGEPLGRGHRLAVEGSR